MIWLTDLKLEHNEDYPWFETFHGPSLTMSQYNKSDIRHGWWLKLSSGNPSVRFVTVFMALKDDIH